jgi:outer membrane lipoprotein-sorting protein
LPAQSAQQLVADIVAAKPPQLSGALQWTVNLGFSGLSALEQETGQGGSGRSGGEENFDPLTLLSDDYQVNVWLDGTTAEHLALVDGPAEEVDLVRNRDQAWLWDSSTQTVTHFVRAGDRAPTSTSSGLPPIWVPPTPEQLAAALLSDLGGTTAVTVSAPLYVAGEPTYQLFVTPKAASGSTVDHIEIDVGATGALLGVPLQLAVYATGQSSPAIELGFTGVVHLGVPPASELTFTPPPGAKVITRTLGAGHGDRAGGGLGGTGTALSALGFNVKDFTTTGTGWTTVLSGSTTGPLSSASDGLVSAATTVVQVAGQPARLFSTVLLNILLMPDGRFYAGLVTPSVLEAAASASS